MDSDMSESSASSEAAKRHISSDMSGPLSGTLDGTTIFAQVTNTCLPADSVLTRRQFLLQLTATTVLSRHGCGRTVLAA
jgi:hypothetical protein